ncbi:hypothetical protein TNCV_323171 [Trichonephila clavipes]|nr:hypothetical protein TNCV_323171 [Trichonephila clavipes]
MSSALIMAPNDEAYVQQISGNVPLEWFVNHQLELFIGLAGVLGHDVQSYGRKLAMVFSWIYGFQTPWGKKLRFFSEEAIFSFPLVSAFFALFTSLLTEIPASTLFSSPSGFKRPGRR